VPALPIAPNVLRVDLHFELSEDKAAKCRFFLLYSGTAPSVSELNTFAASVGSAYNTHLSAFLHAGNIMSGVKVTDLSSSTAAVGEDATPYTGTRSGAYLSADVATLLHFTIARRYRGGHPRMYLPFGVEGDLQDQQTWTTAYATALGTAWTAFQDAVGALTWTGGTLVNLVNVSFYQGFSVHMGTTGRARNVSTPRGTAVVDQLVEFAVQLGLAAVRKRLLRLA
jgi:hypothetical protein